MEQRETLEVDVLYVGGGVACLSSAIHLAGLIERAKRTALSDLSVDWDSISIAVLEKGEFAGAHSISGAVLDPGPLAKMLPDYEALGAPLEGKVIKEKVLYLTSRGKILFPIVPPTLRSTGKYIVSLSKMNQWLAQIAENRGVDIFTGFAATDVLYDHHYRVLGVRTGDKGISHSGQAKGNFEPGMDLKAKVTVFGEGSHGSLTKTLVDTLKLNAGRNPQNYVIGVKEVWQIQDDRMVTGEVVHTMGFPHKANTYGGGFIYGMRDSQITLGLLTGLDYEDPFLDPHQKFQKFKMHPYVADLLKDGKILQYGVNTVPVGGYFAIPQTYFDGGLIVGDSAGLFVSQKLKGVHTAIQSGMLAAETVFDSLVKNDCSKGSLRGYQDALLSSSVGKELYKSRNFHQLFQKGLYAALLKAPFQYAFGGRILKKRLPSRPDWTHLAKVKDWYGHNKTSVSKSLYDGVTTFDKENDVYYSGSVHEEDQPSHIKIGDLEICYQQCLQSFGAPCQSFCPANVYEIKVDEPTGKVAMRINFTNCLHCKTCDIKCPHQNITWTTPEGGGGPRYTIC